MARLASGGQHGLAQSIFQVGGNAGTAVGPLLAAWIIIPYGRGSVAWFSLAALMAMFVLWRIGDWYRRQQRSSHGTRSAHAARARGSCGDAQVGWSLAILVALMFSKYLYLTSLSSYYTFYLISKFHPLDPVRAAASLRLSVRDRAGHAHRRSGRRSHRQEARDLGFDPGCRALYAAAAVRESRLDRVLVFIIGLTIASAFSAILVFAQELLPGRVGTVSGLFFGLAFGIGGIGAALLGKLADCPRHRICLQRVLVPAADRAADRVSAGSARSAAGRARANA